MIMTEMSFFSHRSIRRTVVIGGFMLFLAIPSVIAQGLQDTMTPEHILLLVNDARAQQNVPALVRSKTLDMIAQQKLESLLSDRYFAHTSPNGDDAWKWFERAGYDYLFAGENLAEGYETTQAQHRAWMASPRHKKNILDPRFTQTGIAIGTRHKEQGDERVVVNVFATPRTVAVTPPNYTLGTFEAPEQLIHRGNDAIKEVIAHDNHTDEYSQAGMVTSDNATQQPVAQHNKITHRMIAWSVVGGSVFAILIAEYYLFTRVRRKAH